MSKRAEFWVGENSIKPGVAEQCDGCGQIQPMQFIELRDDQFLCRKCSGVRTNLYQMFKMVRLSV